MRLLIVDDSKAMQNIITKTMKGIGYINDSYHYANDGKEALDVLDSVDPDLIITDLHMPVMNGIDMIKQVREKKYKSTILLVSIDDTPELIKNVIGAGANAFLKKPFTPEALYTKLSELKEKRQITDPRRESKSYLFLPSNESFERIFSALSGTSFTWNSTELDTIDYDQSPFYGGTYLDEKNRLVLAFFLDIMAANLMAAILSDGDLEKAAERASRHQLGDNEKTILMRFLQLLSGICKPTKSGELLSLHGEHIVENARTNLELRVEKHKESTKAFAISCGPCNNGKIILF